MKHRILPIAAIIALLASCATVPETGRNQVILISPQEEARQSAMAFSTLKRQSKISNNPTYNTQVRRVGNRIARVAPVQASWEFVVFDNNEPNAFALPGGKIGIHTGLFRIVKDDAMLATVIGHEIGHVVARHGAERASQGMLVQLGGTALNAGLSSQSGMSPGAASTILGAYGAGAQLGVILPYSRVQEYEADRLGLIYMARAGYDPRAALRFWKAFREYSRQRGGSQTPVYLRTHPLDDARIANLEKLMPMALDEYRKAGGR
ncbi:MAG: M48 family metallopeptidase [Luteolibacter sp.]|jgi:metalloendopeptidase OMA1, mitochondrial